MSIYNSIDLKNKFITEQSKIALANGHISKKEYDEIKYHHPIQLYSPNLFVAIGLLLLTFIIFFGAAGLGALILGPYFRSSTLFLLLAIISYASLEYICSVKKHKNSGTDIALMTITTLSLMAGLDILIATRTEDIIISFLLLLLFIWFTYRYVNLLSGIASAVALIVFVFNLFTSLGDFTIFTFPFVLMMLSAGLYIFSVRRLKVNFFYSYYSIFKAISLVGLIALYAAGNYFVVAYIVANHYFITSQSVLSFGLLFWLWTFFIPAVYFYTGFKKKNLLFIRTGIGLMIVSVITFRLYYQILSIEYVCLIFGVLLIILSYYFMQLFKKGKFGFIYKETRTESTKLEDLEAFAVSQIAMPQQAPDETTKFGGGNFGGAGSGSSF